MQPISHVSHSDCPSLMLPLPSIFAFSGLFFATITIPHYHISYTIGCNSSQTPDHPILCPCPCLSPHPSFSPFLDYFWTLFCHYHHPSSLYIIYYRFE